jgi:LDH2 family malate/lactate/ureidoglycolate dehydrogenase
LVEHFDSFQGERRPIEVLRDRPGSALVDGGNQPGMVVAERATRLGIEKAKAGAMATVAANNLRYSGLLAYYVERVALEGLVGIAMATGYPCVAPYGGRVAVLGTNPVAFGFPAATDPIVVDMATSAISGGELLRRARAGEPLPAGVALDVAGMPTSSAADGLEGVLVPFGGHRGFGLAVAVQLLGVLGDMEPLPTDDGGRWRASTATQSHWSGSFLIVVLDPSLFGSRCSFEDRAAVFAEAVRATPPAEGFDQVRMPFDRSRAERRSREVEGVVLSAATRDRLAALARPGQR